MTMPTADYQPQPHKTDSEYNALKAENLLLRARLALLGEIFSSWAVPKQEETENDSPHSRACGMWTHAHGQSCHTNCPTCHGQ